MRKPLDARWLNRLIDSTMQLVLPSSSRTKLKPARDTKNMIPSVPSNRDNLKEEKWYWIPVCSEINLKSSCITQLLITPLPFHSLTSLASNINYGNQIFFQWKIFLHNSESQSTGMQYVFLCWNKVVRTNTRCVFYVVPTLNKMMTQTVGNKS